MPRHNWVKWRAQRPSAYVAGNLGAPLIGSRTVNDPDIDKARKALP
jgi:hypothetical protein